ncbi:hypothetical protein [Thioclava sp. SK-1]|uniref:hypothetical protein n=1 Tax=Thioclava sp. SK-1 TaxID=1889770 RepID=UPI003511E249
MSLRRMDDDEPTLAFSPLLRGAVLTLSRAAETPIGLTATKAFKRDYVHWALTHFDWPGRAAEDILAVSKVVNEADFPPLELIHFLLIHCKLGRHFKGTFRATKEGVRLASSPASLFAELIPLYLFEVDHSAFSRTGEAVFGNWDTWLNVMNVELEGGKTESDLYRLFYGELPDEPFAWRKPYAFGSCVLRPLEWAGLVSITSIRDHDGKLDYVVTKTPLWQAALQLETDDMVPKFQRH